MDAIKFINEHKRMCASYTRCQDCPLFKENTLCTEIPSHYPDEFAAEITKAIEDWSAAHPVTTRADIFKKIHPNAVTYEDGSMHICPHDIDKYFMCPDDYDCGECRKNYWLKEVQNER